MIVLNGSILIIIFLLTFHFKKVFSDFTQRENRFLNQLFFFHFLIAIVFNFYIENYGGDAIHYWDFSKTASLQEIISIITRGSPSGVIFLINFFFANVLGLSFFVGNMIYASFGFIGFVYLFRISKSLLGDDAIRSNYRLFGLPVVPWIWFLPNLHFWSSGIGKDVILFFCIAIFVYGLLNIRKRILLIAFALLLALAIRPHVALFLIVGFGVGYVLDGNLKVYQKISILLVAGIGLASMFGYVLDFIQLESFETSVIEEYTAKKSASLNKVTTGSGVDTSGYPFLLKLFTFLYRPLFFDGTNVFGLIASVENLFLIIITITSFGRKFFVVIRKSNFILKGILIYFLMGSIAFSLILGNLGIMLRQKNMFIPLFLILLLYINISAIKKKLALNGNHAVR